MTFEEKTISSEVVYDGIILKLRKDLVETVNGIPSYREILEHRGGVALVAVTDDNKLVMVSQFRKPVERVMLEIPAGKIEEDENPMETAIRELKEETGFTAKNISLLSRYYPSVGYSCECLYIYLCTGLTPGDTAFDDTEAIDISFMDFKEAFEKVVNGEIEDGKTALGIMQAYVKLNSLL